MLFPFLVTIGSDVILQTLVFIRLNLVFDPTGPQIVQPNLVFTAYGPLFSKLMN